MRNIIVSVACWRYISMTITYFTHNNTQYTYTQNKNKLLIYVRPLYVNDTCHQVYIIIPKPQASKKKTITK